MGRIAEKSVGQKRRRFIKVERFRQSGHNRFKPRSP